MSATMRLLIADDNEELTEILSCRFTRLGADGNVGLCLVQQLRALRPAVPLVMLSGNDDGPFIDAPYAAGVVQHLLKPCSLAAVETAVLQAAAPRLCPAGPPAP